MTAPAQPLDIGILMVAAYQQFVVELRAATAAQGFDDTGRSDGYVFRALAGGQMTCQGRTRTSSTPRTTLWSSSWARRTYSAVSAAGTRSTVMPSPETGNGPAATSTPRSSSPGVHRPPRPDAGGEDLKRDVGGG